MDYTPFSYVTAEKADRYREVMRAFVEAKSHSLVHLRPEDVQQQIGEPELATVQAALTQLVTWGNLGAERDNARVTSVEDYYRALYVYQITRQGEAVERRWLPMTRNWGGAAPCARWGRSPPPPFAPPPGP